MKPMTILAALALVLVALAIVVGCDADDSSYAPVYTGTTTTHHYHHTTPRTAPKYKAPAFKPAAPRVPSFSKGRR